MAAPRNSVKAIRKKRGLTQSELAARAGTSQQQIQRIESGHQLARLDLAAAIAAALDESLHVVFPAAKRALENLKKQTEPAPMDERLATKFAEAGIDADPARWLLKLVTRNGVEHGFWIDSPTKDRLYQKLWDAGTGFVIFDSDGTRVAVNVKHLAFWQFLFESPEVQYVGKVQEDEEFTFPFKLWLSSEATPRVLGVDPDEVKLDDDSEDELQQQLQHLFYLLEMSIGADGNEVLHVTDEDGEDAYFRDKYVCMITVPLAAVEPELREAIYEGEEEADAAEGEAIRKQ
jgi:transcriptional regulator with XRE-family HTH domain